MDATHIFAVDESIKNHMRLYYQKLTSGQPVKVSELVDSYRAMVPSLHHHLSENWLDVSALNYALTRLPPEIKETSQVIMVNNRPKLSELVPHSRLWRQVSAPNRRRLCYYHPVSHSLVMVITSDSDIDDIVNALITIQIESVKIHQCLKKQRRQYDEAELINLFGINADEWLVFKKIVGLDWKLGLASLGAFPDISMTLYRPDDNYNWIFEEWIDQIKKESLFIDLFEAPVYFVSSNTHSLTNLITGYVWSIESRIFDFIEKEYPHYYQQWLSIKASNETTRVYDFVYYLSKIYLDHHPEEIRVRYLDEFQKGIRRIVSQSAFDTITQIIPLSSVPSFAYPDPQLSDLKNENLKKSQAVIINVEYPLGRAAFYLLDTFLKYFKNIKGIYIVGKAAILNGNIGDIQIPRLVLDEKTGSTFTFDNVFNRFPVISQGVQTLESQKALSIHGTYLENRRQLENYQASGYNVVEMESGSYLSAIYHQLHPDVAIQNGNYEIGSTPYELGIVNYASDNPLVQTLGDKPLIIRGIEPTYAATSAVIHRIVQLETQVTPPVQTSPQPLSLAETKTTD